MEPTTPQNVTLSNKNLIKYTLASIVFALVVLVTIILPAEYNIDPTGLGKKLGLTVFNEVAATSEISESSTNENAGVETIEVVVPAGAGVEYKFMMDQYQKLTYEWVVDGPALYFDLHGESEGDTTGYFESYAIATLSQMKGSFTAPFTGSHGWYWKNKSGTPVTILLIVNGEYTSHALK